MRSVVSLPGTLFIASLVFFNTSSLTLAQKTKLTNIEDVETKTLKAGQLYQMEMTSPEFDCLIAIKEKSGQTIAVDDDGGEKFNARLLFVPQTTQEYQIVKTSYNGRGRGEYQFTMKELKPMLIKQEELTDKDEKDRVRLNSYAKKYPVSLKKDKTYLIYLLSKDFDPYLRVEDSKNNQVARDDDSGGDFNARLLFQPKEDGEYQLIATSFKGGDTGKILISVYEPSQEIIDMLKRTKGKKKGDKAPPMKSASFHNGVLGIPTLATVDRTGKNQDLLTAAWTQRASALKDPS